MTTPKLFAVVAATLAAMSAPASGQTVNSSDWARGTTLAGFVGGASASSDADVAAGVGLGWEIAPHFTLEGRGTWFRPGHGAKAYSAALEARVPLLRERPLVPFAAAGIGMHRATFDPAAAAVPEFYSRRTASGPTGVRGRVFDDFMLTFGGGADIFLTSHVALRPEVSVALVTTRSDVRVMPVYGVHVAYHFETHPILR